MLALLTLPIEVLRIIYYAICGLFDVLRSRRRMRIAFTVTINARRDQVWRFYTADRIVLDGPPPMEFQHEPLADNPGLWLTRVFVSGELRVQSVSRELERDEDKGIARARTIDHPLSIPPAGGRDIEQGIVVAPSSDITTFTMFNELTPRSFRERIVYPVGLRRMAKLIKQQCEKEAGTGNRLSTIGNNGVLLSAVAVLSFWYLLGWQLALLATLALVLHEAGHALAMIVTGIGVRGIYLVPFFGGAAVPKTAYGTQARLGFVALMGPFPSLIPTLVLLGTYQLTGKDIYAQAAELFAVINASNLLPIYPLDGGRILNAVVGSASPRAASVASWVGLAIGLCFAAYFGSFLIGIPFFLFALQRYLGGGQTDELQPLTLKAGVALTLASIATFTIYLIILWATWSVPPLEL